MRVSGRIGEILGMTMEDIFSMGDAMIYTMDGTHRRICISRARFDLPEYIGHVTADVQDMEEGEYMAVKEWWSGEYTDDRETTDEMARDKLMELFGRIPVGSVHIEDMHDTLFPMDCKVLYYEGQTLRQFCYENYIKLPECVEIGDKVWE